MDKAITSKELFTRIMRILSTPGLEPMAQNQLMHDTLVQCCHEGTKDSGHAFGNLFSQVDYLCNMKHIHVADKIAIQTMRRHSNSPQPLSDAELKEDIRALCIFISAVFSCDIPSDVNTSIPQINSYQLQPQRINNRYIRCIVQSVKVNGIEVSIDQDNAPEKAFIPYQEEQRGIDHSYLKDLVHKGTQLNLLDNHIDGDLIQPTLIVTEPDFLLDTSSIASCFTEYGHHPLLYLLNQMKPKANTQPILLGNLAGSILDDIINSKENYQLNDTIKSNYQEKALEYSCCNSFNPTKFYHDAENQAKNILQGVNQLFSGPNAFDKSKAILEPSFICEALGIEGRVDLMTTDFRLLIEQKSGRNMYIERQQLDPVHHGLTLENHWVQLLLYFGILHYNFHTTNTRTDIRLFYSKYPPIDGMMSVVNYHTLFREAIKYRNQVVSELFNIATKGFNDRIDRLTPESLNIKHIQSPFYHQYLRPQIAVMTDPLHTLSPLERHYFDRMVTFVIREQVVSKVGAQEGLGNSYSDLWNMPLAEKKDTGNIYTDLHIIKKEKSSSFNGYDTITLAIPDQGAYFLPNFRKGDMVNLYGYSRQRIPNVRQAILLKGILQDISSDQLVVHLNDGQQNPNLFHSEAYAIEHGSSDVGTTASLRNLHRFISSPQSERDLLLGQRKPERDQSIKLSRHYDDLLDPLLKRAKQARDYFLLLGPPGTGKTSCALQFMVREALTDTSQSILLMAYTNRAVDEICNMLLENKIDFLRIGNPFSCDKRYQPYLISNLAEHSPKLADFMKKIRNTRIIVGTTSMISSKEYLFSLKQFKLAIVDEASQILEPNIIGLLTRVKKFILIGDHKQLPAVVQQEENDSKVLDEDLNAIGLTNCRNSLFERLLHWERKQGRENDFIGVLNHQGRMHPSIAEFPGKMFYARECIQPVPLPHQKEKNLYPSRVREECDHISPLDHLLLNHRIVFIPSNFCRVTGISDKVNSSEAEITAQCLKRIFEYTQEVFKMTGLAQTQFDAIRTAGVIVPYRNQIAMIRKEIEKLHIPELLNVSIDTVERYQGSQRDYIIYSFTVQDLFQLEFLTASCFNEDGMTIDRKLNVALTRARKQTILTGNPQILDYDPIFRKLIAYCQQQKGYYDTRAAH
ncbi:AAA domain-containing protein [Prevotella cerevisiae]|uniref:AAA domain-containing protein n=1 Tax=Segatella cerevisiae TaxID=2053716 RepID=A0ABT1BZ35_9BACT|nr:AAA domain-containing protein [Segatella cerevisiae]MCO6026355.1 AAA domain-containing protein [Segatella cerevisiae]